MRNKPRELYLTTYQNPEPAVVYDMAKCHPDFFTKEQQWHLIEYSAYQALLEQAERMAEILQLCELRLSVTPFVNTNGYDKIINALETWKEFKK